VVWSQFEECFRKIASLLLNYVLIPDPCSLVPVLLRFLVRLVFAAAVTELLELQTARGRLLVLRRRVIPFLALSALQRHNFPHFKNSFQFQVFRDRLSNP
jgi:hypothetical protein